MPKLIADLFVQNPVERDDQLSAAVANAIHAAKADKSRGVLITRHHYSRFSVTLCPTVPYGQTRELDLL
ncbi:hypothetical protein QF031_002232 [Pseudarthrobacter defluvii]|uniref:hypothetical protein n=1 Tax=Pseudarthrobacter defluvii TaxID=410837 RepID=UPI0027896BAC|nr:hypothetical protein [Pseudarthrobacter defluvii]MDQ0769483.1 hypothetical protein [Pseudarthrobacter defluvii]